VKGRRQIVAAGLDQNEIELWKFLLHLGNRGKIDGSVLADGGVWAAAGLHSFDSLRRERARAHEIFGVPLGVDVVGDRRDLVAITQLLAQRIHERRLARSDRAAHPHP
jgi:hypothetical protein